MKKKDRLALLNFVINLWRDYVDETLIGMAHPPFYEWADLKLKKYLKESQEVGDKN